MGVPEIGGGDGSIWQKAHRGNMPTLLAIPPERIRQIYHRSVVLHGCVGVAAYTDHARRALVWH